MSMNDLNIAIAVLTARVLAGILFTFQGSDKIFKVGMQQLFLTMKSTLGDRKLPDGLIRLVALGTSWIEFIGGLLLIAGLFTPWVTYVLCLDLIIVSAGFSMAKPMWDSGHVFFRLALLLFLLLAPVPSHCISLDCLFGISSN